jgi:ribulose-5-phosphate 4-epimerase/fuculose-1-phosphate aldolase
VIHTHTWASMAVSTLECGLLPITQTALLACNSPLCDVAQPIVEATSNNYQRGTRRPYGLMEWPALLRKLERIDPCYRS